VGAEEKEKQENRVKKSAKVKQREEDKFLK
jgi:hypothetical protein